MNLDCGDFLMLKDIRYYQIETVNVLKEILEELRAAKGKETK